jgi:hypothetical protein
MIAKFFFPLLALLIASTANSNAEVLPVTSYELVQADSSSKNLRFMVLPIVFRSPDTGFAFGVLPQVVFRTPGSRYPSSVRMDTYYTQENQYHFLLRSTYRFPEDAAVIDGTFSFKNWPTYFYGVGPNTPEDNRELFTENLLEFRLEATRPVTQRVYTGLGYSLRHGNIRPEHEISLLNSAPFINDKKNLVSGITSVVRYDSRDNHFYPTSGSLHRAEFLIAMKPLGSDQDFTMVSLDFRHYIQLFRSHVLALQAVGIRTGGNVPFRMLPSTGSTLRGYSTVRNIDRNLIALQAEYRVVPAAWRFGFTVFAGAGEVFHRFDDIRLNRVKYTAGIGIRYIFSREEKINIRLDYGVGRNSSGDYIDLTEAF